MAIETLAAFIERATRRRRSPGPTAWSPTSPSTATALKTAIQLANKKVFKAADNREDYTGMGTTVVAALVTESTVTVGSAGDSRCYLFRDGKLTQLTRDDSWVSAAWAEGILSPDEIERAPAAQRHHQGGGRQGPDRHRHRRARTSSRATSCCSAPTACTR